MNKDTKERELSSCQKIGCVFYKNGVCTNEQIFVRSDTGEEVCCYHPEAIPLANTKHAFDVEALEEWLNDIRYDLMKLDEDLEDTIEYLRTQDIDDDIFNSIFRKLKNIRNEFEPDINIIDKIKELEGGE